MRAAESLRQAGYDIWMSYYQDGENFEMREFSKNVAEKRDDEDDADPIEEHNNGSLASPHLHDYARAMVRDLLRAQGRHNMRPAHLHFLIHKPGFKTIASQGAARASSNGNASASSMLAA